MQSRRSPLFHGAPLASVCGFSVVLLGLSISASVFSADRLLAPGEVTSWDGTGCGERSIPLGLTGVKAIAVGVGNNAVLLENGTALSWPTDPNGYGYWYDGWSVPPNNSNFVAVAAGPGFSVALKSNGTVVSWGSNSNGAPPVGLTSIVALATRYNECWGVKSDGSVVAWSNGAYLPVPTNFTNVASIAAGGDVLALRFDGTVVAFGNAPPPWLAGVVAIAAGTYHNLALREDGSVVAWGDNSRGQITIPTGLSNVVAIAAGNYYSLALKGDGRVVVWRITEASCTNYWPFTSAGVVAIAAKENFAMALGGYRSAE